MQPRIQKHIFSVVIIVGMFVLAAVFSLAIVVVQAERETLNAEVCRTNKRIKELENKVLVDEKNKLDELCSRTRLRMYAEKRGALYDVRANQIVRVRLFNVPYGRASDSQSPRDSAISLATSGTRVRSFFPAESESKVH